MTPRRVVAVVPDLLFATRIAGTALRLGVTVEMPAPAEALAAGVDQVLPRSAFTARLPVLWAGEGGTRP